MIQTDRGSEFIAGEWLELTARYGIKNVYSRAYSPTSQGCIERFNRTLKQLIYRWITQESEVAGTHKQEGNYKDALPILLDNYNDTWHSTIKSTPQEVHTSKNDVFITKIRDRIEKHADKVLEAQRRDLPDIGKGDHVRVSLVSLEEPEDNQQHNAKKKSAKQLAAERAALHSTWRKSYKQNWSQQVYVVEAVFQPRGKLHLRFPTFVVRETLGGKRVLKRRFARDALLLLPNAEPERKTKNDQQDASVIFPEREDTKLREVPEIEYEEQEQQEPEPEPESSMPSTSEPQVIQTQRYRSRRRRREALEAEYKATFNGYQLPTRSTRKRIV